MNKVFKDLLSFAPAGKGSKQPAKDKGKFVPRTPVAPESVETLAVVPSPSVGQLGSSKKKKSKHGSDRSSSQLSPKCLKEAGTDHEKASTFNFLNKKIMVVDRVVIGLNNYERNQFVPSSRKELRDALLEANVRALLLSRVAGEELLKEDSTVVEDLKSQLVKASSLLKSVLADNEGSKREILSLRKLVEDLGGENRLLRRGA